MPTYDWEPLDDEYAQEEEEEEEEWGGEEEEEVLNASFYMHQKPQMVLLKEPVVHISVLLHWNVSVYIEPYN